jgi:hypothetical protein
MKILLPMRVGNIIDAALALQTLSSKAAPLKKSYHYPWSKCRYAN